MFYIRKKDSGKFLKSIDFDTLVFTSFIEEAISIVSKKESFFLLDYLNLAFDCSDSPMYELYEINEYSL